MLLLLGEVLNNLRSHTVVVLTKLKLAHCYLLWHHLVRVSMEEDFLLLFMNILLLVYCRCCELMSVLLHLLCFGRKQPSPLLAIT